MKHDEGFYRTGKSLVRDVMEDIESKYHNSRALRGMPTGFQHVDSLTNGLRSGKLTMVISDGDDLATSFLLSIARNALFRQKHAVRFISFRHSEEYVATMLLSIGSQLPVGDIVTGTVDPESLATLVRTAGTLYESSLELASIGPWESGLGPILVSSGQIRPDVVLLDGVQYEESTFCDVVGSVREWAQSMSSPVVLSLRRGPFDTYTPGVFDLLDSVWSLCRSSDRKSVTLSVERNRHGPTGWVSLEHESGGIGLQAIQSTAKWSGFDTWHTSVSSIVAE